jgi:hypothetical protein
MATFAETLEIKRRVERRLLALPGVHGVGLGGKVSRGIPTGEFSIRVLVAKKRQPADLSPGQLIPANIAGAATDVVESAPATAHGLEGGIDIILESEIGGLVQETKGTLGCFARTLGTPPKDVLLSNDHILYGTVPRRNNGEPVKVESSTGCSQKTIAHLLATTGNNDPLIDAAIADLVPGTKWQARIHGVPVSGTLDLRSENIAHLPSAIQAAIANHTYAVNKFGSTSGLTRGKVVDVAVTTTTRQQQLQIMPFTGDYFSKPGDSGSAIYNDQGQIVALLWGGSFQEKSDPNFTPPPFVTESSHIEDIQTRLQIKIATNDPSVVYRVGGKPQLHPALARVYTDLSAAGRQKEFVKLHARHSAEIRQLLKESRPFVVAWHRNYGPEIVRALSDLAQNRRAFLPLAFEGKTWADCLDQIEAILMKLGSDDLQASILRYRSTVSRFGGRSYQEVLGFLLAAEELKAGIALSRTVRKL